MRRLLHCLVLVLAFLALPAHALAETDDQVESVVAQYLNVNDTLQVYSPTKVNDDYIYKIDDTLLINGDFKKDRIDVNIIPVRVKRLGYSKLINKTIVSPNYVDVDKLRNIKMALSLVTALGLAISATYVIVKRKVFPILPLTAISIVCGYIIQFK